MQPSKKLDFTILILGMAIVMLLMATSCNKYGNKCLSPGELNGSGRTKFNK